MREKKEDFFHNFVFVEHKNNFSSAQFSIFISQLLISTRMLSLKEELKKQSVIISDGAWGTFLMAKGLQAGECPELWNVIHPEKVAEIAQSYKDAGARIVKTNSFGGSTFKLKNFGLENRCHELNKAAATISRQVAGDELLVLASIGPTGKFLITAEVTEEELYECFRIQAMALAEGGADVILVETMTDLEEAKAAIKAAKENTKCEVVCTMTFDKIADGTFVTMMGVSPDQMVTELTAAGVDAIGANCGNGMEGMIEITKQIRAINSDIPVVIHANAGLPQYLDGKTVFPESPEMMSANFLRLKTAGANVIGGCCGTSPAHIQKLVEAAK
jgi:5-methyltetrahydrofolate--homocysteine methyltransferase